MANEKLTKVRLISNIHGFRSGDIQEFEEAYLKRMVEGEDFIKSLEDKDYKTALEKKIKMQLPTER